MSELMAVGRDSERFTLQSHTLIGRSRSCALRLDDPRISAVHAQLQWTPLGWELRDLGSRNGTWLDGHLLEAGQAVLLRRGALLSFGSSALCWRLLSDEQPPLAAVSLDGGEAVISEGEILALPSPDDPRLSVFRRPDLRWVIEGLGASRPVADGEIIALDGHRWRLHLPTPQRETLADLSLAHPGQRMALELSHSLDEEHVKITLRLSGRRIALKPRAHNYLLLTLARARRQDAQDTALSEAEQGWLFVPVLSQMLGYSESRINVEVYRARRQLEQAGIGAAAELIERRHETRQLRLGVRDLLIRRL